MTTFTVASGPINFGFDERGDEQDFLDDDGRDASFFAAEPLAQKPVSNFEASTSSSHELNEANAADHARFSNYHEPFSTVPASGHPSATSPQFSAPPPPSSTSFDPATEGAVMATMDEPNDEWALGTRGEGHSYQNGVVDPNSEARTEWAEGAGLGYDGIPKGDQLIGPEEINVPPIRTSPELPEKVPFAVESSGYDAPVGGKTVEWKQGGEVVPSVEYQTYGADAGADYQIHAEPPMFFGEQPMAAADVSQDFSKSLQLACGDNPVQLQDSQVAMTDPSHTTAVGSSAVFYQPTSELYEGIRSVHQAGAMEDTHWMRPTGPVANGTEAIRGTVSYKHPTCQVAPLRDVNHQFYGGIGTAESVRANDIVEHKHGSHQLEGSVSAYNTGVGAHQTYTQPGIVNLSNHENYLDRENVLKSQHVNGLVQAVKVPESTTSCLTSGASSPSRPSSLHASSTGTNLDAGRRKLEQFKRKKAAVLARKAAAAASGALSSKAISDTTTAAPPRREVPPERKELLGHQNDECVRATVDDLQKRATVAEAAAADISKDLDRVIRQLEIVDAERTDLQREKANLVGEILALKNSLEILRSKEDAQGSMDELSASRKRVQELESELQNLRLSHQQELEALTEKLRILELEAQESESRRAQYEQYASELGAWGEALQAESAGHQATVAQLSADLEVARQELASLALKHEESNAQTISANIDNESHRKRLEEAMEESERARKEAELKASLAEENVMKLTDDLIKSREELKNMRIEFDKAREELEILERVHLKSPTGPQSSGSTNDATSLRYRLAKAESALEKERTLVSSLERQIRDAESAAMEGRAATSAAFDLRQRCEASEREVETLKAHIIRIESEADTASRNEDPWQDRLKLMEERAMKAERTVGELQSQCDASSMTMSKLLAENEQLMNKLNQVKKESYIGEENFYVPSHAENGINAHDTAAMVPAQQSAIAPQSHQREAAVGRDDDPPTDYMNQWSQKYQNLDIVQPQQELFGQATLYSGTVSPGDPTHGVDTGMVTVFEGAQAEGVQMVPPNKSLNDEVSETKEKREKRRVGFWGWLAGADLLDDEEEDDTT